MLTGQAKVDYQREYMRRRRAGVAKPPKAEREPTPQDEDGDFDTGAKAGSIVQEPRQPRR